MNGTETPTRTEMVAPPAFGPARPVGHPDRNDRRPRLLVLAAVAVLIAIAAVATGFLGGSDDRTSVRSGTPAPPQTSVTTVGGASDQEGTTGAGVDFSGPTGGGQGVAPAQGGALKGGQKIDDGGLVPPAPEPEVKKIDDGPIEVPAPQPQPQPQPEPQPEPQPLPAHLVVAPDPVNLKSGVYSGSFTASNTGTLPMHWTASVKPTVELSSYEGDLAGGSGNIITFTIDPKSLETGAFSFYIKVTGNGGTEYVKVNGYKPLDKVGI